jgi:hypothetical protein
MKKTVVLLTALLITVSAVAQNYHRAVSARMGTSVGVSFKQFVSSAAAFELMSSVDIVESNNQKLIFSAYGQYHYDKLGVDGLSIFGGPGTSVGLFISGKYQDKAVLSFDIITGVEYKLQELPLVLAFDWNPKLQMITDAGIKPANFGVTLRYTF